MAEALTDQAQALEREIRQLSVSLQALRQLKAEVLQMQTVNFKKYADIIVNLQMQNEYYYLIKRFDDKTLDHIRSRFDWESGQDFLSRFQQMTEALLQLQAAGVPPESAACQQLVEAYWALIQEFTKGDMSLLPGLVAVGNIDQAENQMEEKQKQLNGYLGPALEIYFAKLAMTLFRSRKMMQTAIEVCGLEKRYGDKAVLRGLDLTVRRGENLRPPGG